MIGLAIITCDRPHYFKQSFVGSLSLPVDVRYVVDDGEDGDLHAIYDARPLAVEYLVTPEGPRRGVGVAKNIALKAMYDAGCDWLFLGEDDIIPTSPRAITGYIEACEQANVHHLCFGPHGPNNQRPYMSKPWLDIYPNIVGAWCVYSRHCIETVGYMDPVLATYCQMEHVEHTVRIMQAGLTHVWPGSADAMGSREWLHEIPGSIQNSSIGHDKRLNMPKALDRFYEINPEGFKMLWPNDRRGWG